MSEIKVNKISPSTGTDLDLGDSGDSLKVPSGGFLKVNNIDVVAVAPSTAGNVLTSNGSAWASAAAAGGGKTLQHKEIRFRTTSSFTAQWPNDNTIPQNTEGLTVTELAITPESATSTFIAFWTANVEPVTIKESALSSHKAYLPEVAPKNLTS